MRTVAIIQARLGSSRFPRKVLADIGGRPMLAHVVKRTRRIKGLDQVVLAVPKTDADELAPIGIGAGADVFLEPGDPEDVLGRYYHAAAEHGADTIIRITGDCPLLNVHDSYELLWSWKNGVLVKLEYLSNRSSETDGWDTEIFSFGVLAQAHHQALESLEREHVGPAILRYGSSNLNLIRARIPNGEKWSVDTEADLELVRRRYADGW